MDELKSERVEDRLEAERRAHRRLAGALLFPIALFPFLSLITYNWRDINWLNSPPLRPPTNLIGIVGAWATFAGYSIFGLAVWLVPLLVLLFSGMLLRGNVTRIGRRAAWIFLLLVALCCLVQLGSATVFDGVLERLNLKPNAGGAVGYWLMTCLLARWFSPFGGGMLMLSIMLFAFVMAIGVRNLFSALGLFTGWWAERQERRTDETADGVSSADEREAEGVSSRAEERLKRKELKEAARRAKEEAMRAREEERRRAEESRAEDQPKKPDKTFRREPERRTPHLEASDDLQETEMIRRRAEEVRLAAQLARDRERLGPAVQVVQPKEVSPVPRSRTDAAPSTPSASAESGASPNLADYALPPITLLNPVPKGAADPGNINETAAILVETLGQFNVPVEVVGTTPGPVVTQYELRPAPNIKVERIASLTANLQMALEATSLRVQAPIPGKNAVGIEIPNRRARPVTFREIVEGDSWRRCECEVPLVIGKDVAGNDLIFDLTKAPHLLVAGATGSGKSVCLNAILNGFLMSRTPEQLRLILVDPKRVEFTCYNELPHLLVPVINDAKKVAFGLRWAITEMEKRYRLLQKAGCRNIVAYNSRQRTTQGELFDGDGRPAQETEEMPAKLPYIVIVVDEVADIMSAVGKEVEPAIGRLTSLSRAVGIHLILATQRPSVDVITGTIKSNIPGRIAFKVSQSNDSRTILDSPGAEELIGKGDMLFLKEGSQLMRAQGAWVGDDEIARVVAFVKEHCRPCYDQALIGRLDKIKEADPDEAITGEEDDGVENGDSGDGAAGTAEAEDEMLPAALEVIRLTRRASTTMLQRRLRIGYTRAARLMDEMEARGIVGPQMGSGARDILVDLDNELSVHEGLAGDSGDVPESSPATDPAGGEVER